jgi:RecA/RadA recombinase
MDWQEREAVAPEARKRLLEDIAYLRQTLKLRETAVDSDSSTQVERLCSGVGELDQQLRGGLPYGGVVEWGCPLGKGGRKWVLRFLKNAQQQKKQWVLWVTPKEDINPKKPSLVSLHKSNLCSVSTSKLRVYPPAWQAQGIDLKRIRFAESNAAMRDFRPVWNDDFFQIIVLDRPVGLRKEDFAALHQSARRNKSIIFVLRDHYLSNRYGNVWAKTRLQVYEDGLAQTAKAHVLRGGLTSMSRELA